MTNINNLLSRMSPDSISYFDSLGITDFTGILINNKKEEIKQSSARLKSNSREFSIISVITIIVLVAGILSTASYLSISPLLLYGVSVGVVLGVSALDYLIQKKYCESIFTNATTLIKLEPITSVMHKYVFDLCQKSAFARQWREEVLKNRGQILEADFELMRALFILERNIA